MTNYTLKASTHWIPHTDANKRPLTADERDWYEFLVYVYTERIVEHPDQQWMKDNLRIFKGILKTNQVTTHSE